MQIITQDNRYSVYSGRLEIMEFIIKDGNYINISSVSKKLGRIYRVMQSAGKYNVSLDSNYNGTHKNSNSVGCNNYIHDIKES